MNALPSNVVDFKLPKKPKVREKDAPPDQRKVAVIPIRAIHDPAISDGMLRVLISVCSYCNRAGVTWVSQARLAKDAGMTKQAISKHMVKLKAAGYIEVVSKHWRGVRPDTMRVIFDPTIDTETAISLTSSIEDTRPPHMKEQQQKEQQQPKDDFTPEQIAANKRRIQEMIGGLSNRNQSIHEPRKIGDILMVKKAAPKRTHSQRPEVVNEDSQKDNSLSTPLSTSGQLPEVDKNTENITNRLFKEIIERELKVTLNNELTMKLIDSGITDNELLTTCQTLLSKQQAEGLGVPTGDELLLALLTISADQL